MKVIDATYQLTLEKYKQINRISYYKARPLWAMIFVFVLAAGLFCFNTYNDYLNSNCRFSKEFFERSWLDIILVFVYLFLIKYFLFGRVKKLERVLQASPLIDAVYNYKFTPEKLQSNTVKEGRVISETSMDWNLVTMAYVYKDLILLRIALGFYFVPGEAFKSREEFEEFKSFIETTVKKIVDRS